MESNKQDDLDVVYVMGAAKRGVQNFGTSIVNLFEFSIRNFMKLLIFMVLGLGIGFGLYSLKTPYYEADFTVSHIRFENDYCGELIRNLNAAINHKEENVTLAEKLKMDGPSAARVKHIAYRPLNEHMAKVFADSLSVFLPFRVEVEVYDNGVLPLLQTSILNYLESNEYAVAMKEIDRKTLDLVEKRVKGEIDEIDSLKRIVSRSIIPRSSGSGIILGEAMKPVDIYKHSMASYEKLMEVNKKQVLNKSFQLMIGYTKSNAEGGLPRWAHLLIGILLGYIVGVIFLNRRLAAKESNPQGR
ncbi:MAG TPA: hypothetical protein PL029_09410 [Bacteroidia bacterium]|nr:hypothetical protein [Bacteroidia bacterium]